MTKKIDPKKLGDLVVKVLKTVYDPEIPVDIYELGLIYDVFLNESNDVKVLMTLTTPTITLVSVIQDYGFPIVAVFFLAYFIYYLYNYITKEITPKLGTTSETLIKLIDRIRMLDNDLIRLRTKIKTVKESNKK